MNKLVIAKSALQELEALNSQDREMVVSRLERLQIQPARDVFPEARASRVDLPAISMAAAGDFRIYFRYVEDQSLLQILVIAKKPD